MHKHIKPARIPRLDKHFPVLEIRCHLTIFSLVFEEDVLLFQSGKAWLCSLMKETKFYLEILPQLKYFLFNEKENHILTVWFRLKCGTDTLQCTACRIFVQPHKLSNIPCLSYGQGCQWTHSLRSLSEAHTSTRVHARDVKNKGRSGTESHKRGGVHPTS